MLKFGRRNSSTLDQERKKVQVVKRNLEAEEERLTSCLKIKKIESHPVESVLGGLAASALLFSSRRICSAEGVACC